MTVAARRAPLSLHPALVVARYTLLSIVRRRWLAFAGAVGLVLLVIDGTYSKGNDHVLPNSFTAQIPHRLAYQVFQSSASITAAIVGGLAMVVAMSVVRDDLSTGAAELLLTKPLPRPWYALGKVATLAVSVAAIAALAAGLRVLVLLLVMDDSAYVADSLLDTLAIAADAFVLGLVVLAISPWGSSLAAALVATILFLVATMAAPQMDRIARHDIVQPEATYVMVAYDLSPRLLSGPRHPYSIDDTPICTSTVSGEPSCTFRATPVATSRPGSSALDVLAWAAYAVGMTAVMLLGIRRFSGRATE